MQLGMDFLPSLRSDIAHAMHDADSLLGTSAWTRRWLGAELDTTAFIEATERAHYNA